MGSETRDPIAPENTGRRLSSTAQSSTSASPIQDRTLGSKVPGVAVLRDRLDVPDDTDNGKAFYHILLGFRATYVTGGGLKGTQLRDWRSLEKMAYVFLDEMEHGPKYWPDNRDAATYSEKLQYSKHRDL